MQAEWLHISSGVDYYSNFNKVDNTKKATSQTVTKGLNACFQGMKYLIYSMEFSEVATMGRTLNSLPTVKWEYQQK